MHKQNIILIVISLVCGIAAIFLARNYVSTEIDGYKKSIDEQYQPVKVVVAARDLKRGTAISADNLSVREVPRGFIQHGTVVPAEVSEFFGIRLAFGIKAGDMLTGVYLGNVKGATFSSMIEKGKRAITFPVDIVSSISGMMVPGDVIDIFATLDNGEFENTLPIITQVQVIATGTVTDEITGPGAGPGRNFQNITLHVEPIIAAKIAHARSVGRLMVTLRGRGDDAQLRVPPVSTHTLLGEAAYKKVPIISGGKG